MSIIYNALQKTQQARQKTPQPKVLAAPKNFSIWFKIVGLLFFLSVSLVIFQHTSTPTLMPKTTPKKISNPSFSQSASLPKKIQLILNGVFLSDTNKIAMINNQALTLGDQINGMTVMSIKMNQVILKNGQEVLALKTIG